MPLQIGKLTALKTLDISDNELLSVPAALGEAVQFDPIKPTLTTPGTNHLKLKHDEQLSSLGFEFTSRHYSSGVSLRSQSRAVQGDPKLTWR